ncbi:MAG: GntR family transcriptional regulator [Micropruina sp.]|nr:GntR family transcriptional regulator [Micropruina sp.]
MVIIDSSSQVPVFEQVRDQLAQAVQSKRLAVGDRLPTVRTLAADLGLATNTVARAYRELEQAGVIETRGRLGTFVSVQGSQSATEAAIATAAYAKRIRELGISADEAVALIRAALT